MLEWIRQNTDLIIAITAFCAVATSFLSIGLTLSSLLVQRKHNRLSVKPIFKIIPYDFENYIAVMIMNAGTGPLLREKLTFSNGIITGSSLIDLMPTNENIKWSNFSKFSDYVISPNQSETLIEIKGDENDDDCNKYKTEIRRALMNIKIECEYKDIYRKKYKSDAITLNYCYGRHFK